MGCFLACFVALLRRSFNLAFLFFLVPVTDNLDLFCLDELPDDDLAASANFSISIAILANFAIRVSSSSSSSSSSSGFLKESNSFPCVVFISSSEESMT